MPRRYFRGWSARNLHFHEGRISPPVHLLVTFNLSILAGWGTRLAREQRGHRTEIHPSQTGTDDGPTFFRSSFSRNRNGWRLLLSSHSRSYICFSGIPRIFCPALARNSFHHGKCVGSCHRWFGQHHCIRYKIRISSHAYWHDALRHHRGSHRCPNFGLNFPLSNFLRTSLCQEDHDCSNWFNGSVSINPLRIMGFLYIDAECWVLGETSP